ncbi:fimbrial biogenesis chaperone [Cronobacter dublinensis]|uniref:Fimbrial chaparone n=1 Tax=Cronobacter dublinensis 1210 TaxID=1208656 RepID=A0ABP1WE28_9ENTR|nr:molecular chaperone [Cronobacter dublinensis]CCJ83371.1 putative fimbrial chaparone [Cronobacter dublinensis 1210]ALB66177.1 long polar fimbrial chaperone LpfB [Cronobacter dublinensis subsp. dublinensis LMG 23823]EGT4380523.1 molecular chaperone [Cronobacter dublinensis]EKM6459026.1 molecular chaperone [Cronobacter dublinensis]EKP4476762.1 molecular chaperone [Cronobacter dublinensis]
MRKYLLISTLLFAASAAQAGVVIGGTRLIYPGDKKEAALTITNGDDNNYLVQSWVETENGSKAPFMITPPLFRLDAKQTNTLRVVKLSGTLAQDRESLFWLNVKSIPSTSRQTQANTLQIAVKTRIKLLYRPATLTGTPEETTDKLVWRKQADTLSVRNPTPFYMNFQSITVGGKNIDRAAYVAPGETARFHLPAGSGASSVDWKLINDYGATGAAHHQDL